MFWATLSLGIRNLLLHKLRSALTMLGTILGVASVIAMLAVGEGSKHHAIEQIRKLGADNVIIRSVKPRQSNTAGSGAGSTATGQQLSRVLEYGLKYADLNRLQAGLPTVERTVPVVLLKKNAQYGGRRIANGRVLGTIPAFRDLKDLALYRGRFLEESDLQRTANVAVLGAGAARRLFGYRDPLHETILLGEGAYRVVGVLAPSAGNTGTPGAVGVDDMNNDIYIPLTAARNRFGELQQIVRAGGRDYERIELSEITLSVQDESLVSQTAGMARQLLKIGHPRASDFEIQVPLELLQQAEREKRIWNMVLGSIAGISLLVGGIGIMNIMLATVTERTREIGIRRALGARRGDIVFQFLIETTALSTIGGLVGIVLGITLPLVVTAVFGVETAIAWWTVLLAFGISVATGIVFGVYPARRAAQMNPIEALRQQ